MPVLADKDRVTHPDDTAFFRDNDAIKLAGSTNGAARPVKGAARTPSPPTLVTLLERNG